MIIIISFQNKISGLQTKWRSSFWKCKYGRTQIWSDLCNEIALMQLWQLNNYFSSSQMNIIPSLCFRFLLFYVECFTITIYQLKPFSICYEL